VSNAERQARWRERARESGRVRLHLYVRADAREWVDEAARKHGISRVEVVRRLIDTAILPPYLAWLRLELLGAYRALLQAAAEHPLKAAEVQEVMGKAMRELQSCSK
jgi:hypothetical protein